MKETAGRLTRLSLPATGETRLNKSIRSSQLPKQKRSLSAALLFYLSVYPDYQQ
jgi:hypothetical protein